MINFILDLKFYEVVFLTIAVLLGISLVFFLYQIRKEILKISILDFISQMIFTLFVSCVVAIIMAIFFTTIIFFIFANKPSEEFINFLKEKNIINQEYLSAYLNNDSSLIDTLGFGHCEIKNYNGKVCNEYLKYVIAKLQKEHQENLKKEQEKLQKEQVEKQKEQIKLKEKNENIENLINDYSKN
ncbi:hypothetical protein L8W41_07050 [Campylobacter sp. IFREMER_LSEM_CL1904]|uniref:hypothetical protein n=1 Tax=Campylobacter sp. IFREMER_LSEM_CL1904 TaxID=2911616 RepID=UPI0021E6346B|nr:hypothetical protein [Campylobacter sp. IFREMER_LSEM_CL1904]MCV3428483.1 hypothetical protein [Campylobacter sp. IFREMER_LSEM_CL1904]